jgi:UDP-GlcNAc3NAcA epimerase
MKILSVIGTRPQYVKVKPIFDYCNENNINHIIVDTNQHYSENVSDYFIKEFSLVINHNLRITNTDEVSFIAKTMEMFSEILEKEKPDFVLLYGDTNSTLSSSLVCYKHSVPFAHIEAGLRCHDIKVPEELNRIVADLTSQIQFTPIKNTLEILSNEVVCGDLEYELLNKHYNKEITFDTPVVMTIHRKENLNLNKFLEIISFCESYGETIHFYIHHSTKSFIEDNKIVLPKNIVVKPPAKYNEMTEALSSCKFIITDSGGLMKTCPFFRKKSLIMRDNIEWEGVESEDYGVRYKNLYDPLEWITTTKPIRRKDFYIPNGRTSKIIIDSIKKILNGTKK